MRVSAEFGALVKELFGADSFGTAALRTQISKAYLVELAGGKVPRAEAIARMLTGYADRVTPPLARRFYETAGYAVPDEWREQPKELMAALDAALPPVTDVTEEEKAELLEMVKGYSSARNESTRHYIAETVKRILEEEESEADAGQ